MHVALSVCSLFGLAVQRASLCVNLSDSIEGEDRMATIKTRDGTELYTKDWGSGKPVVFTHGWPLSSDMLEYQMNDLASHGLRCIAYDRRGFGRSSQPWSGYDFDTFTDDLKRVIETLELEGVTLVGFS